VRQQFDSQGEALKVRIADPLQKFEQPGNGNPTL